MNEIPRYHLVTRKGQAPDIFLKFEEEVLECMRDGLVPLGPPAILPNGSPDHFRIVQAMVRSHEPT